MLYLLLLFHLTVSIFLTHSLLTIVQILHQGLWLTLWILIKSPLVIS
uniref:Uncharacterized protein n=1 Tax=Aegilops tauschii subsp. strangulata TaxID=200361 RepID=A0A453IV47_AEGTS